MGKARGELVAMPEKRNGVTYAPAVPDEEDPSEPICDPPEERPAVPSADGPLLGALVGAAPGIARGGVDGGGGLP